MNTSEGWGTVAEKRFIDGLGRHSLLALERATLLRDYIAAMALRYRWGSLDRYSIEAYARASLRMKIGEGAGRG